MSRAQARAIRRKFRDDFQRLAMEYAAAQDERYPREYREQEQSRVLKEVNRLEALLTHRMLVWNRERRAEADRVRHADPVGDAATETRRLREQMEIGNLAEQFPSAVQGRNILLPEAWKFLNAGNVERAQVYVQAARKVGAQDGTIDREINRLLDATVPHRRKAVEIEVAAADEVELARRDVAEMRLLHKVGSDTELVRASTAVKMHDYKRAREADILQREHGIELPTATD